MPHVRSHATALLCAAGLLTASGLLAACTSASGGPAKPAGQPGEAVAEGALPETSPTLAPLTQRVRPDVMVIGRKPLRKDQIDKLYRMSTAGFTTLRVETVLLADKSQVEVLGVNAVRFRPFAPQGTAEATPVWEAIARGEVVVAHEQAQALGLKLGKRVFLHKENTLPLRLGAIATTGLPDVVALVSESVADRLGFGGETGALLSAGSGDPVALARTVQSLLGADARVQLLSAPAANPTMFISGTGAARAFGAFSYRYYPDGTIEPDRKWVRSNIVTRNVPIFGRLTCHRLMFYQLTNALAEVQARGLASKLHYANGCYVPRFIENNPRGGVSLHTWGIAIDFDSTTNRVGTSGAMDRRIVAIFKKWGFSWGGDWRPTTDPMHFQLAALLKQ